jgi:hypothetical protein
MKRVSAEACKEILPAEASYIAYCRERNFVKKRAFQGKDKKNKNRVEEQDWH